MPAAIFPSVASADQSCLKDELRQFKREDVDYFHLDIEDGHFVPNITFGIKTLKDIGRITPVPLAVHLMVDHPEIWIQELGGLKGVNIQTVAFHLEASLYPKRVLSLARRYFPQVGIAINPATDPSPLAYLAAECDYFLVMTAEPDFEGQGFILPILDKIGYLLKLRRGQRIWADGDIGEPRLFDLWGMGVEGFVLGRALFGSPDPGATLRELREKIEQTGKG